MVDWYSEGGDGADAAAARHGRPLTCSSVVGVCTDSRRQAVAPRTGLATSASAALWCATSVVCHRYFARSRLSTPTHVDRNKEYQDNMTGEIQWEQQYTTDQPEISTHTHSNKPDASRANLSAATTHLMQRKQPILLTRELTTLEEDPREPTNGQPIRRADKTKHDTLLRQQQPTNQRNHGPTKTTEYGQ